MVETVVLRGATLAASTAAPAVLQRTDQEFIEAVLEGLKTEEGRADLAFTAASAREKGSGVLRLFQPVHRTFHVAVLETYCASLGKPRLDPDRIESAGLVVRRIAVDERGIEKVPEKLEGWRKAGPSLRGWVPFDDETEQKMDPDPIRRPLRLRTGNAELDRRLALRRTPAQVALDTMAEDVSPLFVAPPDVCEAAGRTFLYGLVPLTSSETSEAPLDLPPYDPADMARHLPAYLRAGGPRAVPRAGETLDYRDAGDPRLASFIAMLKQLVSEFGVLDDIRDAPPFRPLFAELNTIELAPNAPGTLRAGDFIKKAAAVLIGRVEVGADGTTPKVVMPARWPAISNEQAARIAQLVQGSLASRLVTLTAKEGRYENPRRRYRLRAFVRVTRPGGCPPVRWWSEPSEPFLIAPWYDTSGVPPVRVSLPDITSDFLANLKPNVAFNVPEGLFNLLQGNDPKQMAQGNGKKAGGGIGLDWICGFNIPIITICAFIVLNIFLSLFDIIFQWMMFIKICIPIPKRK